MRVIAGEFRGRVLKTLPGMEVRPTPDRLREALFSILAPRLEGEVFLDAYAGTGSVGIEALSRGAARAVFIEKNRAATAKTLDIADRALAKRPFIAADRLTMGDIPLGCYVHLWMSMPIERPAHPNLTAWYQRLLARPAFNAGVNTPLT